MAILRFCKRLLYLRIPGPCINRVLATLSILGLAGLFFLVGAVVMHFRLPPSEFLHDAFLGAEAWREVGRSEDPKRTLLDHAPVNGVTVDVPGKTDDGFTLFTTTSGSWAALIDMKGRLVHQWHMPFSRVRAHMSEIRYPLPDEQIHWFGCRLFPNGDLLAVYHGDGDTPFGYGLVKMDKDSRLLWAYPGRVHHDVDVGEDGAIYCIKHTLTGEAPPGMDYVAAPYVADKLVVLSPEGKELHSVSLLQAFRDSKYASTLQMNMRQAMVRTDTKRDYLHPNRAMVLSTSLAPKFPLFQAGQVLVSLRNIDTLAVLDVPRRTVVWSCQGAWRQQHAAGFLPNGHLLLFDNVGACDQTRVLEYDPVTQTVPWSYADEGGSPFLAHIRGTTQRLSNGNTLIVDPGKCRIFEVTERKEVVWETFCLEPIFKDAPDACKDHLTANMNSARRYYAHQLTFLKGGTYARP